MQCDEYLLKQIDDLKKQIHDQQVEYDNKIEKLQKELKADIKDLKNLYHEQDKELFKDKLELQSLIASAVAEGNRVVIERVENEAKERKQLEVRVSELENEKANTALKQKKYILTGFAIALFSNIILNIPYIIKGIIANWK